MASRTLKRTNIGISDSVVAFMVAITWTVAPVVKVKVTQDFKLTLVKVSHIRGEYQVVGQMPVTVKAGQTLYFAKSEGFEGHYYLVQYNGTHFGCTCKAGRFHQKCHHQEMVNEFVFAHTATETMPLAS